MPAGEPIDVRDQAGRHLQLMQWYGVSTVRRGALHVRPAEAPVADAAPAEAAADEPVVDQPTDPPADAHPDGLTRDGIAEQLEAMRAEVAVCELCPALVRNRRQTAFADGTPFTPLMFVGEAPGQEEDRQGVPFVGPAGQKLTEIIEKGLGAAAKQLLGLDRMPRVPRSSVFIANVLKCRPPNNRNPEPEEVANCRDFLHRQIRLVRPRVIVALGLPSARRLTGQHDLSMGRMRGRRYELQEVPGVTVVPTYHPAYLLRSYTVENRKRVMADITEAMRVLVEDGLVPWWT